MKKRIRPSLLFSKQIQSKPFLFRSLDIGRHQGRRIAGLHVCIEGEVAHHLSNPSCANEEATEEEEEVSCRACLFAN